MQATNKKGAPTQQAANAFAAQMKASRVAPHTWQDFRDPNAAELANATSDIEAFLSVNSTRYPQRPIPLDDRDSDVAMIKDLATGNNKMITAARPYPIQDWELEYMKSKAAAEDYAAYQQWLSNKYDLNDMATRAWFKQIAPEYFSQKRELLKELMDRHAKYSYLRMAGPENEEDLRFEYAVETGRIPIPKGPFYNPIEWAKADVANQDLPNGVLANTLAGFKAQVVAHNKAAYQYGLFNPVKPRNPQQSANTANINNPQDIMGNYSVQSYGFPGQNVPQDYNWSIQYNGANLTGGRDAGVFDLIAAKQTGATQNGGFGIVYNPATGKPIKPAQTYDVANHNYGNVPDQYQPPNTRLW
jgi:hypothetical protein